MAPGKSRCGGGRRAVTLDPRFPYKESEERDHFHSLARPTNGFLDFGRLGLVLGPLIQGNALFLQHVTWNVIQFNLKCK